jgi:hypothetical protein
MSTCRVIFAALAVGLNCATALAQQRSQLLVPRPLPADIAPRVQNSECGSYVGFFGPMDFRNVHPLDRRVVEAYHLDRQVEIFLSGRVEGRLVGSTGPIGGDLMYTIRSMPNHPVAMLLLEQLGRRLQSERPQNLEMPLECIYVRAFALVPDDPVVWALYGIYLAHRGRAEEAAFNLDRASPKLPQNGALQYQMGLANFAIKRWEQAQLNALVAERNGFSPPGLRAQLRALGSWNDSLKPPSAPTPDQPASAARLSADEPARDDSKRVPP